jgi:multidrug efflux pump subunit AcrA (membrane-fusion protein)
MPLLIGDYVRVEIHGRRIDGVYRIPRSALRDNTHVWVATDQNRLDIRTVTVAWRDTETVLVQSGLEPGERLIISDLSAPVGGMALRVTGDTSEEAPPARNREAAG